VIGDGTDRLVFVNEGVRTQLHLDEAAGVSPEPAFLLAVTRWRPRLRFPALAAAGAFWLLWGVWQAWLLLART